VSQVHKSTHDGAGNEYGKLLPKAEMRNWEPLVEFQSKLNHLATIYTHLKHQSYGTSWQEIIEKLVLQLASEKHRYMELAVDAESRAMPKPIQHDGRFAA
jgi:exonuclease V gamma subunit